MNSWKMLIPSSFYKDSICLWCVSKSSQMFFHCECFWRTSRGLTESCDYRGSNPRTSWIPSMFYFTIMCREHGSLFSFSAKVNFSDRLNTHSVLIYGDYMTFLLSSHCRQHHWSQMAKTLIKYVPSVFEGNLDRPLNRLNVIVLEHWAPMQI